MIALVSPSLQGSRGGRHTHKRNATRRRSQRPAAEAGRPRSPASSPRKLERPRPAPPHGLRRSQLSPRLDLGIPASELRDNTPVLCKPPRLRCLSRQPWGAHTLPTPGTPPRPGPRETLGTSAALNRAEACPDLGSTPGRGERSAACVCWEMPRAAGRQGPEAGGAGCVLWVGAGTARLARGGLRARTGASQELAGANAEATGRQGGGVRLLPQELLGPPLQDSGPPQGSRRAPLTPSASWHRGLVGSLGATVRGDRAACASP